MICNKPSNLVWFVANHQSYHDFLQLFFIVLYTKYGLLQNIHLSMICSKPSILVGLAAKYIHFWMLCCKIPTLEWFATNHQTWYDLLQTINLNMIFCNQFFIVLYTKYCLLQTIHFWMLCCKTPTLEWFATNNQTWYDSLQTNNLNMIFCKPFFIVLNTKYGLLQNIHLSMICSKPSILVWFVANHQS
jgi:hypothetical protein